MRKIDSNPEHKKVLDAMLLHLPGVTAGKMFGYPAYYFHRKLFACVYGDGVGVKVPEDVATRLLSEEEVVPFQPMGRPKMREWVRINRTTSEDYRLDLDTFLCAIEFAGTLDKK
jgi:TfoX/Sxy family transcriptional regulator of competence genes